MGACALRTDQDGEGPNAGSRGPPTEGAVSPTQLQDCSRLSSQGPWRRPVGRGEEPSRGEVQGPDSKQRAASS